MSDEPSKLPNSAIFCCGGLRALVQIGPNLYGVFEYGPDAQGRPRQGHEPTDERHVCPPRG
jgi:hypothetical protein